MDKSIGLAGHTTVFEQLPAACPECQCKEFYKQSDFKRSIGLVLVSIASLSTFVLMYMGFNWFVIWSPMLVVLIFDRVMLGLRPVVAVCYNCKHVIRGLPKSAMEDLDGFELEIYDRYKYKEEHAT
jgi:hypothetical protein